MRAGARIAAAAEVLDDILNRHRPAATALADWGKAHRFAGSGDRAAIGTLVFDALRRRASIAARMGSDTPRALALGAAAARLRAVAGRGQRRGRRLASTRSAPLSDAEQAGLAARTSARTRRLHVAGDFPAGWCRRSSVPSARAPPRRAPALAARAPVDLRVNTLKATPRQGRSRRSTAMAPRRRRMSPAGVRVPAPEGAGKAPHLEAEAAHGKGWFEVQDEGSQIAALLAGAGPRMQVLDLCAGAGGKTLALAAAMQNTGQIYAYDADKQQLRPIFERLKRAGARNVQVMDGGR